MANLWCDGFGRYGGTKSYMLNGSSGQAWAEVTSAFALSTANPRTGTHCLRLSGAGGASNTETARRVFGAPLTEVYVGQAIYCSALPGVEPAPGGSYASLATIVAEFRDQSNESQIAVILGTDGALDVLRKTGGGSSVSLGRTIPIIGAGAYQHVEIYAKAGNGTAGAIEIRVDEVTRLNLTGVDTVYTASVEFSQVVFGFTATGGISWPTVDRADVYANGIVDDGSGCDNFVGDVKSGYLAVNADTAQADFSLSSGVSGYALLDEAPPNDADYISTTSSTARSDFGLGNGPANLSEILTVRSFIRAYKDDAGTCTVAPSMKSGAVTATVPDQPITTAFAYYDSNVPVDPNTGAPWTAAALNAASQVIERTA